MKREIDMREISDGKLYVPMILSKQTVAIATAVLRVVKKWDNQLYWIPSIFID